MVAGGINEAGEVLKSVEIIYISSKSSKMANNMLKPRAHFHLIVLGKTILAIGHENETSIEVWENIGDPWKEASVSLNDSRRNFSALVSSKLICLESPPIIPAENLTRQYSNPGGILPIGGKDSSSSVNTIGFSIPNIPEPEARFDQ